MKIDRNKIPLEKKGKAGRNKGVAFERKNDDRPNLYCNEKAYRRNQPVLQSKTGNKTLIDNVMWRKTGRNKCAFCVQNAVAG